MALGTELFLFALILFLFSMLDSVLDKLKISPMIALAVLLSGFAATLPPAFEITQELIISAFSLYLLVIAGIVFFRLRYARYAALFSALFGGLLAFGAQTLLWNLLPVEPGLLPGILAGCGSVMAGRYRRARLFGGLIAPLVAVLIPSMQTLLRFGYVYILLGGQDFIDMAAASFLSCCLFCALAQHVRSNVRGYSTENMRLIYKRK